METGRKWCRNFIVSFLIMMVILGTVIVVVDPYFHYHKPLKCLAYQLYNERYQNDGEQILADEILNNSKSPRRFNQRRGRR